jgi:signal recognition particle receptor subunit beta
MFFDWVEVDGGKLGGMDLRVQILSVPGQSQRSYRRRPLLFSADTVVFVADSTDEGLPETRRSFKLLARYLREREDDVPLLMQANKQDIEGARTPDEVLRSLVKNPQIDVVGASAHTGAGVRETFQAAMKLAIKSVRERVQRDGPRVHQRRDTDRGRALRRPCSRPRSSTTHRRRSSRRRRSQTRTRRPPRRKRRTPWLRRRSLLAMQRRLLATQRRLLAMQRRLLAMQRRLLAMQRRLLAMQRRLLAMQMALLAMQRRLLAMQRRLLAM